MTTEPNKQGSNQETDIPLETLYAEEINSMLQVAKYIKEIGMEKGIKKGLKIGTKLGIKQGIQNTSYSFAKKLLEDKLDSYTIQRITSLTLQQIEDLKKEQIK
jgi:maleate cis-trans isomerase